MSIVSSEISFYNKFHKDKILKVQHRIVSKNNFTYRVILSELERFTSTKNLNILDYGCGVGTLALYFASKGHKVTGIDVSSLAIKTAKLSANNLQLNQKCKFYTLSGIKLDKFFSKYDLIICSEVLEHVDDDLKLIKLFKNLLVRNGLLFITTPSLNAPLFKFGLLRKFDREVGHLRRYSAKALTTSLHKIGYKVIFIIKTEGILRNSLFTLKLFGPLLKFVKGPISDLFTYIDNITLKLLGESNIHILVKK